MKLPGLPPDVDVDDSILPLEENDEDPETERDDELSDEQALDEHFSDLDDDKE